jgi:Fanconi anemia group M protein
MMHLPSTPTATDLRPTIIVDHRERSSDLAALLANTFPIRIATLSQGDYQIGDQLTIERKTARDLLISIIDLRLFRQVANLKHHCRASLLLIEGDPFQTDIRVDHRAVKGALFSIQAAWQLPILFTSSAEESCEAITTIARQNETFSDVLSLRGGYRPRRLQSQQLYILQGLPGIGPELAKRLLDHFHSVAAVMTAAETELTAVPGIGQAKARQIRMILDSRIAAK